jgi:ATP adenylyltransferase
MMDRIWAPWRSKYILNTEQEDGCILCNRVKRTADAESYILHRGEKCFIIMNIFPYNNGHLMVAPYKHTGQIEELDAHEGQEILACTSLGVQALKKAFGPDGFNIGMNIGIVAGAGIPDHLHMHIVPRWNGDTNFMPVLTDTKILSVSLDETYRLLKERIEELL